MSYESSYPLLEFQPCKLERLENILQAGRIDRNSFIRTVIKQRLYKSKYKTVEEFGKSIGLTSRTIRRIAFGDRRRGKGRPGVYFIWCSGFCKIGWTEKLACRRISLQTGSPHEQKLLMHDDRCTKQDERIFHERFADIRYRGEWFYYTEELRDFIEDRKRSWRQQHGIAV